MSTPPSPGWPGPDRRSASLSPRHFKQEAATARYYVFETQAQAGADRIWGGLKAACAAQGIRWTRRPEESSARTARARTIPAPSL